MTLAINTVWKVCLEEELSWGSFGQVTCVSPTRNASKISFFLPYLSTRTQSVCSHGGFVWRPVCLFIPFNLPGSPRRLLYSLPRHLDTDRFIILFFFKWMLSTVSQLCLFCEASMSAPEFIVGLWEGNKRNRTAVLLLLPPWGKIRSVPFKGSINKETERKKEGSLRGLITKDWGLLFWPMGVLQQLSFFCASWGVKGEANTKFT